MPGVDLKFNEIDYKNFAVVVLNLQAPSVLLGFQVGGIVGHKFLSPYRVSLDLDRSELRMTKATTSSTRAQGSMGLRSRVVTSVEAPSAGRILPPRPCRSSCRTTRIRSASSSAAR